MLNFSRTVLGIELGTTRIKAVLLDENHVPVASGSHVWENRLENGIWTYSLEDIVGGVQSCYADLRADIRKRTGEDPTTFGAIGVSAMMHGYLPLDKTGVPLAPFRTWRNTVTGEASEKLTELFRFISRSAGRSHIFISPCSTAKNMWHASAISRRWQDMSTGG